MKRDMELIREILLSIEAGQKDFDTLSNEHAEVLRIAPEKPLSKEDAVKLEGHLDLLEQAGLIEIQFRSTAGNIVAKGLTWQGHELVDSIRDPEVWRKTKHGAMAAGGWTLDLLKELANGYLKKQIEDRTGIKM